MFDPSELSLEPIRADALILLNSDDDVLHIEFQTEPDTLIPFRMADYRLRGFRRFPHKRMRQVVIYQSRRFGGMAAIAFPKDFPFVIAQLTLILDDDNLQPLLKLTEPLVQ